MHANLLLLSAFRNPAKRLSSSRNHISKQQMAASRHHSMLKITSACEIQEKKNNPALVFPYFYTYCPQKHRFLLRMYSTHTFPSWFSVGDTGDRSGCAGTWFVLVNTQQQNSQHLALKLCNALPLYFRVDLSVDTRLQNYRGFYGGNSHLLCIVITLTLQKSQLTGQLHWS